MNLGGIYPCVIKSYDRVRRLVRIEIPPFTDGAEILPEAQLLNMIGDKSWHTEIRILPDDLAWCMFLGGDPRYPIVIGYRTKNVENDVYWRRWHHENFESKADNKYWVEAGDEILLKCGNSTLRMTPNHIELDSPRIDLN